MVLSRFIVYNLVRAMANSNSIGFGGCIDDSPILTGS